MSTPAPTNVTASVNSFGQVTLSWSASTVDTTAYTESGSIDEPANALSVTVMAIGGGGGGGGGSTGEDGSGGGGGGGGIVTSADISLSDIYWPMTFAVGGAGAGGAATKSGTSGGSSAVYFTEAQQIYLLATGGAPGENPTAGSGAEGNAFGAPPGTITTGIGGGGARGAGSGTGGGSAPNLNGNAGSDGSPGGGAAGNGMTFNGVPVSAGTGGAGSGTYGGAGGDGGIDGGSTNDGATGGDYGGGGGGGAMDNSSPGSGGAGAPGVVVVSVTYSSPDSFNVYRGGVLIGSTTGTSYTDADPAVGSNEYCITAVLSGVESSSTCATADVAAGTNTVFGAFAPAGPVWPPIALANLDSIEPRIYRPGDNTIFKSIP